MIAASEQDRETFCSLYALDNTVTILTGVDFKHFSPQDISSDSSDLVIVGSRDWLSNEDAVFHFAPEILSILEKEVPAVYLTVVGKNLSSRFKNNSIRCLSSNSLFGGR